MEQKLTIKEAYKAMLSYLDNLYERTSSDDLGEFLGSMQLTTDGSTMDPAAWVDWLEAIDKIKQK